MDKKESKFKELAAKRVNKAIDTLRLVGNLSNSNNYSYSNEDVKKILSTIDLEVKNLKLRFLNETKRQDNKFTL